MNQKTPPERSSLGHYPGERHHRECEHEAATYKLPHIQLTGQVVEWECVR